MKTTFTLYKPDVSGECEFFIKRGEMHCALYKVDSSSPMTAELLSEVENVLLQEAERIFNDAYISSLSSIYLYGKESEPETWEVQGEEK